MATGSRPVRTLLPMACDGIGPSLTCTRLLDGAHGAGYTADLFATRSRAPLPRVPVHLALRGPLAALPYRWVGPAASRRLERRFLASIRNGDIAYLWPAASLAIHEALHARGIPIVLEGINTRMASARRILDAAYETFGVAPVHGITDQRIAEEEAKLALATAIFAPGKLVESALTGSPLEHRIIPASYGVDTTRAAAERTYTDGARGLVFLFCGTVCVRKGAHHLLEAWKHIPAPHRLRFVGKIEPVIAQRYAQLLGSNRVEVVGFVRDVHPHFAGADVFVMPSLEEGSPQVTYEAALHGLPIVASPMGASRIGDVDGSMLIVDPASTDALAYAMTELARSLELRQLLGRRARAVALGYHWPEVGARRMQALHSFLAGTLNLDAPEYAGTCMTE